MQVFDLNLLREVTDPPVTFSETAHYPGFDRAHNVAIDEETGYAYAVGSNTCSGGLHMVDVSDPTQPTAAGCFDADGYTHDVQCVLYHGPDVEHQGREICFASNEDTVTIVDVTDKSNPLQLSRTGEGFDLDSYLGDAWSVYRGRSLHRVVLRFDPQLAPLLENACHHEGEETRRLEDGGIEYRVRLSHLDEIARWVLGFGGACRVAVPAALRKRVLELATGVVEANG